MAGTAIVLGSASPRRRELFSHLFPRFSVATSSRELEDAKQFSAIEFARENTKFKAKFILRAEGEPFDEEGLLFTFDTVVERDGITLGKPSGIEQAQEMLKSLSGRSHEVHTAYLVVDFSGQMILQGVESTKVWFQPLDENLIEAYISSGDPMDKAGAYGIQSFGGILVKRIEGCFYNVMGLPVSSLYHRLRSETELLDSLAVS